MQASNITAGALLTLAALSSSATAEVTNDDVQITVLLRSVPASGYAHAWKPANFTVDAHLAPRAPQMDATSQPFGAAGATGAVHSTAGGASVLDPSNYPSTPINVEPSATSTNILASGTMSSISKTLDVLTDSSIVVSSIPMTESSSLDSSSSTALTLSLTTSMSTTGSSSAVNINMTAPQNASAATSKVPSTSSAASLMSEYPLGGSVSRKTVLGTVIVGLVVAWASFTL